MTQDGSVEYKKRFGYWLICFSIFFTISTLAAVLILLPSEFYLFSFVEGMGVTVASDLAAALKTTNLSLFYSKIVFAVSALVNVSGYVWILKEPKLTTESGHFLKLLCLLALVNALFYLPFVVFLHSNSTAITELLELLATTIQFESAWQAISMKQRFFQFQYHLTHGMPQMYVSSLLNALAMALVNAAILTIDESYTGCCSCLKCLKPFRPIKSLPLYNAPEMIEAKSDKFKS